MQEKRSKKTEQAAATRGVLLAVARRHFSRDGFAGAATEAIVAEAEVTRGALYFHFKDKRDLFRALVETVAAEIAAAIEQQAVGDPWSALSLGCAAYLDTCARADIRQIYLVDGPAVLGWRDWRAIDAQHNVKLLRIGLRDALGHAESAAAIDALTLMLSGAMNEAALAIADAPDADRVRDDFRAGLDRILLGLNR